MPPFSQADRAFRVDTPLGTDVLLLEGFSGQEAVSRPFKFTLELLSTDASIDPLALLRAPVSIAIRLREGAERIIHGRVIRFAQGERTEGLTSYEAEIAPWLWFLSLSADCRIFQDQSVPEIIEAVFGDHADAAFENRCVNSYPPREYCVQYRESDLNFVSRLMEEEGIFYFFEHSDSGHTLVLADDADAIQPSAQARAQVNASPDTAEEEVILDLRREHAVYPSAVTLNDYDPLHPSLSLYIMALAEDDYGEVYDFPGGYVELSEGERYASLILEERSSQKEVVRGSSSCRGFQSGCKFELLDYYRRDANQPYLLLSVQHMAGGGGYRSGRSSSYYRNQFSCIPMSVPYRPPRSSRKPVVRGAQTAVVVGPAGEEVYTDEHARVKVQFHWDREGQQDENSSCWVRVATPWGGKGYGSVSIPRIGNEVVVDFLEGDPDRPLIVGSVYNAEQTPPFQLPGSGIQMGMKSRSSPGGGGNNEITMTDTKGKEMMNLHAQYDQVTVVQHDQTSTVHNNKSITVDGTHTEAIKKDSKVTIDGTHTQTIKKDTTITVSEGNLAVNVSAGKSDEYVKGNKGVKVDGQFAVEAKGNSNVNVTSGNLLLKSGAGTITEDSKTGHEIKSAADVTVKGMNVKTKADAEVTVDGLKIAITGQTEVTLAVGGNFVKIDPSGVTIFGTLVKIN